MSENMALMLWKKITKRLFSYKNSKIFLKVTHSNKNTNAEEQ